jgi:CTP:molybdopterin cytidylyltransferase MocA
VKREAAQLGMTVDELARELRAEQRSVDVILMAYGNQERLAGAVDVPKQLLPVDGDETILARTLRLLANLLPCKVGICAPPAIAEHAMSEFQSTMVRNGEDPANHVLVHNMFRAAFKPSPDHAQLFLLADVVWSPADLARVLRDRHPSPIFYGRQRNAFTRKEHPELFALWATPAELEPHCDCGTLWDLQRRIGVHAPVREIHGYTDDVDTPDDVAERLPLLRGYIEQEAP